MYGTPAQVAALASAWTSDGEWIDPEGYNDGTNPTLTTVNQWLENLSSQMDIALQTNWFNVPIDENTSPAAYASVSQYVCELAADLARKANGVEGGASPGRTLKDMLAWVEENADGFLKDNVSQTVSPSAKKRASITMLGNFGPR